MQGAKVRAHLLQMLDHLQEMAHRPRQTIETYHDQHVAGFDLAQQLRQYGSGPRRAGTLFFEDFVTAGSI